MLKKPIAWTLAAVLFLTGCCHNPHDHGGEFVAEYKPGDHPDTTTTPYKATYVLYQWAKPPDGPPPQTWIPEHEVTQLYLRGLDRQDKIGFDKDHDQLIAVAGSERIPLENGHYCWHITSETEYHGGERILHEAGDDIVAVVSLPFDVVTFTILLPLFLILGGWLLIYFFPTLLPKC